MDDATREAHDKENTMRVFADMESIIGNYGFQFKETVMSGDPMKGGTEKG